MGTAKDFDRILHKEIDVHAAWLPVTNVIKVGDFGLISDGVFARQGNIRDVFGVDFETDPGPAVNLDFKSEKVREVRFTAGAEVDVFPDQPLEAKLTINFERSKSFYLKAKLDTEQMKNSFAVALALVSNPNWRRRFKVVSGVYNGTAPVIMSSRSGNTEVSISAKADVLQKFELGNAEAGLTFKSSSSLGLEILGEQGVVGLQLFQVGRRGEVNFLAEGREAKAEEVDFNDKLGEDLEDDI